MRVKRASIFVGLVFLLAASSGCKPVHSTGSLPPTVGLSKASPSPVSTATTPPATSAPLATLTAQAPSPEPVVIAQGTASYIRPPTVQFISETSAIIVFELDNPDGYSLRYWPSGQGVREMITIPLDPGQNSYTIKLQNLSPGADYLAGVFAEDGNGTFAAPLFGDEVWDPVRIHTLPEGGLPIRIAVLGDSGFGQDLTHDLTQAMADQHPDVFIHAGDLVYNAGQEDTPVAAFQFKFFATLAPILHQTAVFPVVGNHELYDDARWNGRAYYYEVFPMLPELENSEAWVDVQAGNREWYQVSVGPFQFLFLNTQLFYVGGLRSEQDQWLAERLADDSYSYSIPIFHVPPYTSGRHRLDGTPVIRSWVPLFESNDVPLVISGHDHNYERLFQNGVTYLVSGGGSSALYQQGRPLDISQVFFAQSHFVILDMMRDSIRLAAYDRTGELLDEQTIELK
jgi:hypothetical protein